MNVMPGPKGLSRALDLSHLGVTWPYRERYDNWINGGFVAPKAGRYFDNVTPITNEVLCQVARSDEADVEAHWPTADQESGGDSDSRTPMR